jgi:hypothetical protein
MRSSTTASIVPSTRGSSPGRKPTSGAALGVEALLEDLLADAVAQVAPAVHRAVEAVVLDRAHGPVERHPHHHAGVGEVSLVATDLPEPVVGLVPVVGELLNQRALE